MYLNWGAKVILTFPTSAVIARAGAIHIEMVPEGSVKRPQVRGPIS